MGIIWQYKASSEIENDNEWGKSIDERDAALEFKSLEIQKIYS